MMARNRIIEMIRRLTAADIPVDSLCYLVSENEWRELLSDAAAHRLYLDGGTFDGEEITFMGLKVRKRDLSSRRV